MIVELSISHRAWTGDWGYETLASEDFLIDTAKVEALLALDKDDGDALYYARNEMRELLDAIAVGSTVLPEGTEKYSLIDTDWEYARVKADDGAKPEKFLSRVVF